MKKCEMNEKCDEIDEGVQRTEAKECEVTAKIFKGQCIIEKDCEIICKLQGFPTGRCENQQCMCIQPNC